MRKRWFLRGKEAPQLCGGDTWGNVEGEDRGEEPEERKSERSRDTGKEIRKDKAAVKAQIFIKDAGGSNQMPAENLVPPRTCLPAKKLERKGGAKLVSERMTFARGLDFDEKSIGRQQVCTGARKDQPRCKLSGLVPNYCLRGPAPLSLPCSFQHPETACIGLHIKALRKKQFFPVQSPTVCQVAWKEEQLHKMPFFISGST